MSDINITDDFIRQNHQRIMDKYPKLPGYPDYSLIFNDLCDNHIPKITQSNFTNYTTCSCDTYKRLHNGTLKKIDLKCIVRICIGLGLSLDESTDFIFICGYVLNDNIPVLRTCREVLVKYCSSVVTQNNIQVIMNEVDQIFQSNNCGTIFKIIPTKHRRGEL